MIEKIVKNYLEEKLETPIFIEEPEKKIEEYILVEKTGSSRRNGINSATVAIQSYSVSMEKAAILNELVKDTMDAMPMECNVYSSKLNTDYPFTDTKTKRYRYQAIYDITY